MRGARSASLAVFALGFGGLLALYLRMVISAAPQEMREGAMLGTTLALMAGRDPYAVATLTETSNLYGVVFPLLATPFAAMFGAGLVTHRIVVGLGLLAASVILFAAMRRQGVPTQLALAGTALNLAGWLYWVGPTVRPDGIALALAMGALAVAAPDPRSTWRFAACLSLSLLAMLAKIYFVFPAGIAAGFVLLSPAWRRGIAWCAGVGLGIAGTLAAATWAMPGYASIVLGASVGATSYDLAHLLRQSWDWALFSLPVLLALAVVITLRRPGFWAFAALCGLAALLGSLGGHPGAHMTYFFHLLSPPLTVAVLAAAGHSSLARTLFILALPAWVVLNAHWFPLDPRRFAVAEAGFAEAARLIAAAKAPLTTTEFAPFVIQAGHVAPENGHTEYFHEAADRDPPWFLRPLWLPRPVLAAQAEALARSVTDGLAARRFDLVIANRRSIGLVRVADIEAAGYVREATIELEMVWAAQSWPVDIWRRPPQPP